jgi:16S rRNA (uracil1498-N3)-methyltransferase
VQQDADPGTSQCGSRRNGILVAMSRYDFNAQRLFVDADLAEGAAVACSAEQANYLRNVLRLAPGAAVLVFNGRDGEWRAELAEAGKRAATLVIGARSRPQEGGPDIAYLFAPLKRTRLDYMVQKATEMGVARLSPVLTRRTVAERVNVERMRANAIEAAEQCGILRVPAVDEPVKLERAIAGWDAARSLVFCDEGSEDRDPLATLGRLSPGPLALLVGPEGGFDEAERELLSSQPFVTRISLGPRILRADTAAVAALALVNAVLGDWR